MKEISSLLTTLIIDLLFVIHGSICDLSVVVSALSRSRLSQRCAPESWPSLIVVQLREPMDTTDGQYIIVDIPVGHGVEKQPPTISSLMNSFPS